MPAPIAFSSAPAKRARSVASPALASVLVSAALVFALVSMLLVSGCASPGASPGGTTAPSGTAAPSGAAAPSGPAAGGTGLPGKAIAARTQIQWLGQAATKIVSPSGKVIVIDPWLLTNPKTPAAFKDLQALGRVDLILVTHAHFDHFADAPALAKMHKVPVYGPAGLNQTASTLGILPAELSPRMNKGGTIKPFGPDGPKITAVRAEHSSELVWKNPDTGKDEVHPAGEPVGFILEMEDGLKIWHMGDTALFGDMGLISFRYHPDVVLIPIGGHFVMNPSDAAFAVREMIRPRAAIPIHYGTTPLLAGTPAEFKEALGDAPVQVFAIQPGEMLTF
jgi:L-ascorbate metabolism protein UlaG (beta-lactamase superfamily)